MQKIIYDNENRILRKEFLSDYYMANLLSQKNLSLDQKKIMEGIIVKFNANEGKFNNLNKYYLNTVKKDDYNSIKQVYVKQIHSNRELMKKVLKRKDGFT